MFLTLAAETRLSIAAPFIVSAVLVAVGAGVAMAVEHRLKSEFEKWATKDKVPTNKPSYNPENLAGASAWAIDAAQLLALLVGPAVGVLTLKPDLGGGFGLLYVIAFGLGLIAFFVFTFIVRVDKYGATGIPYVTWVTFIGVVANIAAAFVAAYAIGP
jgi:hypothetical protein